MGRTYRLSSPWKGNPPGQLRTLQLSSEPDRLRSQEVFEWPNQRLRSERKLQCERGEHLNRHCNHRSKTLSNTRKHPQSNKMLTLKGRCFEELGFMIFNILEGIMSGIVLVVLFKCANHKAKEISFNSQYTGL